MRPLNRAPQRPQPPGGHRRAEALGYVYKARHPEGTRRARSGHAGGLRTP